MLVSRTEFLLSSRAGSRVVPAKEFFIGPSRTVLRDNELLERIVVPQAPGASAYKRFTPRRAMDLAVVGVAAYVEVRDGRCVDARIALSAAAATPVLACDAADALIGSRLDESAIRAAATLVLNSATPIDDARGSREQRRAMLPVLAYRAVTLAHTRALARREGERGWRGPQ
jgi:CO/xanthine dehydrogenase FAD-binding subunit